METIRIRREPRPSNQSWGKLSSRRSAATWTSRPPRSIRPLPSREMLDPVCPQPLPQGLVAERGPVALDRPCRSQSPKSVSYRVSALALTGSGNARARDRPPAPPSDEAPDVAWPQLQEGARLHLHQRLLHRVANHWHQSERLHTHDDPVFSDSSGPSYEGRQSRNEADISIVVKAIVSLWEYRTVNMTVWIVRTRE